MKCSNHKLSSLVDLLFFSLLMCYLAQAVPYGEPAQKSHDMRSLQERPLQRRSPLSDNEIEEIKKRIKLEMDVIDSRKKVAKNHLTDHDHYDEKKLEADCQAFIKAIDGGNAGQVKSAQHAISTKAAQNGTHETVKHCKDFIKAFKEHWNSKY